MQLVGREKELKELVRLKESSQAEFVVLYGRRRVGKTIREAHEKAVAVSAFVCTQRGAMPLLPAELKA